MTLAKKFSSLLAIIFIFNNIKGSNSRATPSNSQNQFNASQNVTTIKTKYGDIYDCVDFYEQPAFKHPQLKNHKFYPEMRPNFIPNITSTTKNDFETSKLHVFENGGCPSGTVPIRRLSEEDRSRAAYLSDAKTNAVRYSTNEQLGPPGTHYAIVQTQSGPNPLNYYGVGAELSVWNPQVKQNQYSASQLTIQNGPDSLQVGWMVNPTMYKDDRTHIFIHTNAGGLHCYNTYCPGFVIVRSDIPPDSVIEGYTERGKVARLIKFFIYRDSTTGNWWLLATGDETPIGFWPNNIFTTLNKYGTYISCGGETYSPLDQPGGLPPMGSGAYPVNIPEQDAFAAHFETTDDKLKVINVDGDTETFMDTKKYIVHDLGIMGAAGHALYFGGYGG
ncbi:hypothetical protein RND81_08G135800 [Saponaria officinalis]|uniref:Neprosin PEP catalytic domain-containing protein n=1 Tax=Saponaria officinalis TaxID=3572 RepID=A0AAW1J651_SAPOF